jgi:molybdopterin synthase catalytic subunit
MAATDFDVVHAVLSEDPISLDDAIAAVEGAGTGAVVTFSGTVRNHDGGRAVDRLSYSAHPMASRRMTEVVAELAAEHAALDSQPVRIWAAHRVGRLEIGDPALVCAVSAAHRSQAFAVCSELVDRIKSQVPIWKEQFFSDGALEWVGLDEEA